MEELFNNLGDKIAEFTENFNLNMKGNKAAGVRARKASLELEKLLKKYRKVSLELSKK